MNKINLIFGIFIVLTLFSCKKEDESINEVNFDAIVGSYQGTLSKENNTQTNSAKTDITKANDEAVYIHCFGNDLDTSFMLNVYENGNYTMTCFTDENFRNEYGHSYENNHMMHSSGNSEWKHHMADEHESSDIHYGSFNTKDHSFTYTFNMVDSDSSYSLTFNGLKK